jgi:hypothetical protein
VARDGRLSDTKASRGPLGDTEAGGDEDVPNQGGRDCARDTDPQAQGLAQVHLCSMANQRLTSTYKLMKRGPPPFYEEDELFSNLHVNVPDESFGYYKPTAMEDRRACIPVTALYLINVLQADAFCRSPSSSSTWHAHQAQGRSGQNRGLLTVQRSMPVLDRHRLKLRDPVEIRSSGVETTRIRSSTPWSISPRA